MRFNPFDIAVLPPPVEQEAPAPPAASTLDPCCVDREAFHSKFVALYGVMGKEIKRPEDHMAVVVRLAYNDTDTQQDYFAGHARFGPDFVVLFVKKGARTEARASRARACLPESVRSLRWGWEKCRYGSILVSAEFPLPPELQDLRKTTGGTLLRTAHWVIDFEQSEEFYKPHACFEGERGTLVKGAPPPGAVHEVTLSINSEKNFVELRFPTKPNEQIRHELKAQRFRWWGPSRCWYNKNTAENLVWAAQFVERQGGSLPKVEPDPAPTGAAILLSGRDAILPRTIPVPAVVSASVTNPNPDPPTPIDPMRRLMMQREQQ